MDLTTILERARHASRSLNLVDDDTINRVLRHLAKATIEDTATILQANATDLAAMDEDNPMRDRLRLTPERLADIAKSMEDVAALPSPLNKMLAQCRGDERRQRRFSLQCGHNCHHCQSA